MVKYKQTRRGNKTFGEVTDLNGKIIGVFTRAELVSAGRRREAHKKKFGLK